jgi:hypothetical protein
MTRSAGVNEAHLEFRSGALPLTFHDEAQSGAASKLGGTAKPSTDTFDSIEGLAYFITRTLDWLLHQSRTETETMSTADSRNKRRFFDNVTTLATRTHNLVRVPQRCLNVVGRVVRSIVGKIAANVSLGDVRTIISISLDLGRLIDRGNAFDIAPSFA